MIAAPPVRSPLSGPFARLWAGETVSLFGSKVTELAMPLTALFVLDAGPGQVGLLTAAGLAPFWFFTLPAGLLADRLTTEGWRVRLPAARRPLARSSRTTRDRATRARVRGAPCAGGQVLRTTARVGGRPRPRQRDGPRWTDVGPRAETRAALAGDLRYLALKLLPAHRFVRQRDGNIRAPEDA